jgi:hypothetical protein
MTQENAPGSEYVNVSANTINNNKNNVNFKFKSLFFGLNTTAIAVVRVFGRFLFKTTVEIIFLTNIILLSYTRTSEGIWTCRYSHKDLPASWHL